MHDDKDMSSKALKTVSSHGLTDDEKTQRGQLRWNFSNVWKWLINGCTTRRKLLVMWDDFRCVGGPKNSRVWWSTFWLVTTLAAMTRMAYITTPNMVIWDEAHFGKMIGHYINRSFFFDVHPTGGKLLLTLFARMVGYNGSHSFSEPGVSYDGYPEIMAIRVSCALLGSALASIAFACAWTMTRSLPTALLAGAFVISEIGTLMLTKFILLDSPLMFFMMVTFLCLCCLHNATESSGAFTRGWWMSLIATGVGLGCVVSVKFVGFFMVAVVGTYTVHELWGLYAILRWVELCYHLIARVLCLLFVPVIIYFTCFAIHDHLLQRTIDKHEFFESHFSPGFQMNLVGNSLYNVIQPASVSYGSNLTVRSATRGGGFLTSYNISTPPTKARAPLQLVTAGRQKGPMNVLQVRYVDDDPDMPDGYYWDGPDPVVNLDIVRIYVVHLDAYIACHGSSAAVAKTHKLAYVEKKTPENKDDVINMWQVVVEKVASESDKVENNVDVDSNKADKTGAPELGQETQRWNVLESRVKFINLKHNCYLTLTGEKLPKNWGFDQPEVSCARAGHTEDVWWYVEQAFDKHAQLRSFEHLRTGVVSRFLETQALMRWTNAQYKPTTAERQNPGLHRPWMWPLCYQSQPWYGEGFRIILLGNPIVFWLNLGGLCGCAAFLLCDAFRRRRRPNRNRDIETSSLVFWCRWLLIAYLLHYLPFYTMDRILYYHHYFPALQFSSLLTAVLLGRVLSVLPRGASLLAMSLLLLLLTCSFSAFSFTAYGEWWDEPFNASLSTRQHLQWLDGWELI